MSNSFDIIREKRREAYPFGSDSEQDDRSPGRSNENSGASPVLNISMNMEQSPDNKTTLSGGQMRQNLAMVQQRLNFRQSPGRQDGSAEQNLRQGSSNPSPTWTENNTPIGSLMYGASSRPATPALQVPRSPRRSPASPVQRGSGRPLSRSPNATQGGQIFQFPNVSAQARQDQGNRTGHVTFQTMMPSVEDNEKVANIHCTCGDKHQTKPNNVEQAVGTMPEPTGELPCSIFYINKNSALQRFQTFDELSDFLVTAALAGTGNSDDVRERVSTLLDIPLNTANHYAVIGTYLKFLYENDRLIDVIIDVKNVRFGAHRIALCCHSDYFAEIFREHNKGSKIPFEITVNGISPESFAAFLEFCYTGEFTMAPEIAADMMLVADYLRVPALQRLYDLLYRNVPLEVALQIVMKSKGRTGRFFNKMMDLVLAKFTAATEIAVFFDMDLELFCKFLESDTMQISSEYEVFTVAMRWLLQKSDEHFKHTSRVLHHIRFCHMTKDELFKCTDTTSLLRGYDSFRNQVLVANWIHTCDNQGKSDPFQFPRPAKRRYAGNRCDACGVKTNDDTLLMPPPLMTSTPIIKKASPTSSMASPAQVTADILVVGGFAADEENPEFIERYDTGDNQWMHFCKLPAPRRHHAVASAGGHLYLIGGVDPTDTGKQPVPCKTVFRMLLTTKSWEPVADMTTTRYRHSACAKDEKIYVIGGKTEGEEVLKSVDCYDIPTNTWSHLTDMSFPRFGTMATVLDDNIYVAGGIGESQEVPSSLHVLRSAVCYNINEQSWSSIGDLRNPRCLGNLVTVNDRLFVCGGATRSYNKNSVLSSLASVEEYAREPNSWVQVAELLIPRHDMGVAVVGERIYMIGGVSTTGNRELQSVECFDTRTGTWVPGIQDLPFPGKWISCTVATPRDMIP